MTLFEYMSIATTLVLSFSLARVLTNIAPIFSAAHGYWVHSLWVLGLLISHVSMFWQLWLYQEVADWTLVRFVLLLLGPIALLIGASLLVPVTPVSDYRQHFESRRAAFYSVLIAIHVQSLPLSIVLFGVSVFSPLFLGNLIIALAAGVGLLARRRTVDMVLVCFWFAGVVSGMFAINDHDATRELLRSLQQ